MKHKEIVSKKHVLSKQQTEEDKTNSVTFKTTSMGGEW